MHTQNGTTFRNIVNQKLWLIDCIGLGADSGKKSVIKLFISISDNLSEPRSDARVGRKERKNIGKSKLNQPHGSNFFQIFRQNFDLGTYKLEITWKLCKYNFNSMVISCSTCQKEEQECIWGKYAINLSLAAI